MSAVATTTLWVNTVVGRSQDQKKRLIEELAGAVSKSLRVPEESIVIYIREEIPENVAKGKTPLSENS